MAKYLRVPIQEYFVLLGLLQRYIARELRAEHRSIDLRERFPVDHELLPADVEHYRIIIIVLHHKMA